MGIMGEKSIDRIIQESVPGKQVTIAHIIASPMAELYERLGLEEKGAIGVLTISPYEAAIIAADIVTKAADVKIGFLDRFTGSLIITGDVQAVETAFEVLNGTLERLLKFTIAPVTRT